MHNKKDCMPGSFFSALPLRSLRLRVEGMASFIPTFADHLNRSPKYFAAE